MGYCFEKALPHSVFLGCECGAWHEDDRAKVIAFALEKAERCAMCNTASWEWLEDPYAYEAVIEVCPGCQQRELARDDETAIRPAGSSVVLLPRAVAARLRDEPPAFGRRNRRESS